MQVVQCEVTSKYIFDFKLHMSLWLPSTLKVNHNSGTVVLIGSAELINWACYLCLNVYWFSVNIILEVITFRLIHFYAWSPALWTFLSWNTLLFSEFTIFCPCSINNTQVRVNRRQHSCLLNFHKTLELK